MVFLALLTIPYLVGAVMLFMRRTKDAIPAVIFTCAGLLVSLSFYAIQGPFHSTLRLMSAYFPAYGGMALINNKRVRQLILMLWLASSFYGTIQFTHQWWWQ